MTALILVTIGLGNGLLHDGAIITCWLIINEFQGEFPSRIIAKLETIQSYNTKISFKITYLKFSFKSPRGQWINSSPPSAANMRQWIGSALV